MQFAFHNWHDFWLMDGYAIFIWPAYLMLIGGFILQLKLAKRRLTKLFYQLKSKHADTTTS